MQICTLTYYASYKQDNYIVDRRCISITIEIIIFLLLSILNSKLPLSENISPAFVSAQVLSRYTAISKRSKDDL